MEGKRSKQQLLLLWAALVIPAISAVGFEDQKNFFYHDPNTNTPPIVSYTPPASGGGGGHVTPTPSHGGGGGGGGGSYGGTPPANCGTPPSNGNHASNPSTTPAYHSPPRSNPIPPVTLTPPSITVPSPPTYDPHSPPYTCTYWRNHPTLIWGLFGWWGSVGNAFGVTNVPGFESSMNLLQALSNTHTDGYGEICREGTAALLNSMVHSKFPYTSTQVRDRFAAAVGSNKAALVQARLFKLANESQIRPRD